MTGGIHRFYAVVHPIDAKIFTSKSRTVKVIASTWLVAVVLALPYLYCKTYPTLDSAISQLRCTIPPEIRTLIHVLVSNPDWSQDHNFGAGFGLQTERCGSVSRPEFRSRLQSGGLGRSQGPNIGCGLGLWRLILVSVSV